LTTEIGGPDIENCFCFPAVHSAPLEGTCDIDELYIWYSYLARQCGLWSAL